MFVSSPRWVEPVLLPCQPVTAPKGLSSHLTSSSFVPCQTSLMMKCRYVCILCRCMENGRNKKYKKRVFPCKFPSSCCTACETRDMLWCDIIAPRRRLTPKRSAKRATNDDISTPAPHSSPIHLTLLFIHASQTVRPPFLNNTHTLSLTFPELIYFLSYSCVAIKTTSQHLTLTTLTDYHPHHRYSPRHRSPSP